MSTERIPPDSATRRIHRKIVKAEKYATVRECIACTQIPPTVGPVSHRSEGRCEIARKGGATRNIITLAVIALLILAGCGEETEPPPEPIVGCDSAGNCWIGSPPPPTPPPTQSEPLTPAEYNALANGRVWTVRWTPGTLYSDGSGVCMMRYPYTPGPKPYSNFLDFFGVCFAVGHHDWLFEINPRSRSGDRWVEIDTHYFRGEIRNFEVRSGRLTGLFEVIADLKDMHIGTWSDWDSEDSEIHIRWSNVQPALPAYFGNPPAIFGDEVRTLGDSIGVYTRARRDAGPVDLDAPFLNVGVDTSLEISSDGSVFAQDADGCIISGQSEDHLGGVWRATFTSSCHSGVFNGFGATIGGRVYIGARTGWDKFVIVGQR